MQIDLYIKELILFQDCVIVPGLGGFVSNYQSAQTSDTNRNAFLPPAKRIVFNQKLKHNDGLLVEHIARHEACSFDIAKEAVDSFVRKTQSELTSHRMVTLTGLGVLSSTKNGYIRFDQSNEENLLLDSFGLGQIHIQPLELKTTNRKISTKTIKRLSVAASVAILIALIPTGVYTKIETASFNIFANHSTTAKSVQAVSHVEKAITTPAVENDIVTKLEAQTDKSNALLYVEKPQEVVKIHNKTFYIVIGCYTDENHIDKAIDEAAKAGFLAELLKADNEYCTYRRLSVGAYSSREAADSALALAKQSYKDAWVLAN